jgi:hypothetical protein
VHIDTNLPGKIQGVPRYDAVAEGQRRRAGRIDVLDVTERRGVCGEWQRQAHNDGQQRRLRDASLHLISPCNCTDDELAANPTSTAAQAREGLMRRASESTRPGLTTPTTNGHADQPCA